MAMLSVEDQKVLTDAVATGDPEKVSEAAKTVGVAVGIPPPGPSVLDAIWLIFICGMFLGMLALFAALIFKDNPAASITTLATAILTGLFGLFVPSPATAGK